MTLQTAKPLTSYRMNATQRRADFFTRNVASGDMTLDPPYQRGDVWTVDQRIGLIRSWLTGVPIPAIIINDRTTPSWTHTLQAKDPAYAVIDGKQRILTAIAWFNGDLAVPASWLPTDWVETTEPTSDGPYIRYAGLTVVGRRFLDNRALFPCVEAKLNDVRREAEVYLLVNGAGTPQTDTDLDRARTSAS